MNAPSCAAWQQIGANNAFLPRRLLCTCAACFYSPLSPPHAGHSPAGGGSLLQQMRQRLQGGRFRWLNEALYTTDGGEALRMMQREPDLMQQYHEGEREGEVRPRVRAR